VNGTVQSRDASGNLVNVTLADTAANTLTGSLGRQSGENVGNYAITNGSLASTNNYALTINTTGANETITAANLTVTAQNVTKTYGADDPTLAYTTSGLVSTTVQSRDASGSLVNVTLADTAANTLTGSLGRQSGERGQLRNHQRQPGSGQQLPDDDQPGERQRDDQCGWADGNGDSAERHQDLWQGRSDPGTRRQAW
jgi:hypothetical protein